MAKAQDAVAGAPRLGSLSLARDFTTAIDYAEQAAVGDRWSAQPHLLQARIYANNWSEPLDRDVADRTKCESQCGQALALDRHSDQTEAAVGYLMLLIAENFGYQHSFDYDASYLQRAIEHFEAAAKLYPNDAMTHANLAMVYNLLDENDPRAVAAANEALRLDDLCPHEERKLANRRLLEEISAAARDDVLYDASGRYIASQTAKQWMLEIRNNAGKHLPAPQSPISHLRSPISHLPESKATP